MRTCLVVITLLVLSDVFCASLPLPAQLQGKRDGLAGNKHEIDIGTYFKNLKIRKDRKRANTHKSETNVRAARDVNVQDTEVHKEQIQALESSHHLGERMLEAHPMLNNEQRKRREETIAHKPRHSARRSYSKGGKFRIRIKDENGRYLSFRKKRSQ